MGFFDDIEKKSNEIDKVSKLKDVIVQYDQEYKTLLIQLHEMPQFKKQLDVMYSDIISRFKEYFYSKGSNFVIQDNQFSPANKRQVIVTNKKIEKFKVILTVFSNFDFGIDINYLGDQEIELLDSNNSYQSNNFITVNSNSVFASGNHDSDNLKDLEEAIDYYKNDIKHVRDLIQSKHEPKFVYYIAEYNMKTEDFKEYLDLLNEKLADIDLDDL